MTTGDFDALVLGFFKAISGSLSWDLAVDRLNEHHGSMSAGEREAAERLGCHMREAMLAHEAVRRVTAQAVAGHGLLNGVSHSIWLMDANRVVLFANDAARREAGDQCQLAVRGARFTLLREHADRALAERLSKLAAQGHGAMTTIDLRHKYSEPPVWLHLSWIVPAEMFGAFGGRPCVLATAINPARSKSLNPSALVALFGLTPTEATVAVRLVEGLTASDIAQEHGTSLSTVRTHIRQLLAKFGMSRTTDVIRLLLQGEALWAQQSRFQ